MIFFSSFVFHLVRIIGELEFYDLIYEGFITYLDANKG